MTPVAGADRYAARVSASGLFDGCGVHAEGVGDLAAVDDEGFLELVLHLRQFPQGAVGQCGYANHPGLDLAEPGARLACLLEDKIDQLPGGVGVRVVGEMPHLARRVGMFAENGEAFADVGDVGVGVRLVGVAEDGGGLSGQGGGEQPVAEVGLGAAARSEVVRGASDGDRNPAGPVGGEQLGGHLAAELPFLVCAA